MNTSDSSPDTIAAGGGDRAPELRRGTLPAIIALLRAADVVRRRLSATLEPHGITLQQYNVLRILRGSHPQPLATYEVGERMMEQTPGVTRLLDRIEEAGWAVRTRCRDDRRLVHCRITEEGLKLLAGLDPIVRVNDAAVIGDLQEHELATLTALLRRIETAP